MASSEDIPVSSALNVNVPKLGLMLSYSHQQKKIVNKIKDRLRRQGYDVWIDSEKMVGPLTPAMAEAVRDAGIVITCLSKKYEESPNCKFEYERMLEYNKPFVALIMEDFKMDKDSWLKDFKKNLFVKFTDEAKFEGNFSELTRVLSLTKDKILKAHIGSQQVPPQDGRGGASSSQQQPAGGSGGASSSQQQPLGGGSGGASSSQQQPAGAIPEDDYSDLLRVVSDWWKKHGSSTGIQMMKVLLRQFKEDIGEEVLQNANDVWALFALMEGVGEAGCSKHEIILEVVKICGLYGVQSDIRKITPTFENFNFKDVEIKTFSSYRRNLIKFGKRLLKNDIVTIGHLYSIPEDKHKSPWLLICALEDNRIIEENSVDKLIERLRRNNMDTYADILSP